MVTKSPEQYLLIKELRTDLMRFMMSYKFALEEINTKINILKEEFQYVHDYNPIEHVKSRLKSPESILKKLERKGLSFSLESIKGNIRDIAGVRITCSFVSDIYKIKNMLESQKDITVLDCKDYIKEPKPNGYQSLHLIVQIPIFMSDREEFVPVEIQIRTIAMDFWASLEHKIYYKYNKEIPQRIVNELKEAAETAGRLDRKMENIHKEMIQLKQRGGEEELPFRFESLQDLLTNKGT
ncbi:GTP pyrophosphokinase [Bacillus sp. J33]|uniref:GTP pyrophosphokinase n=1 Tax=Bacillus sp. J33 TaxID=935836 RepID=UPI00047B3189|nr:GTP pyrophosphokinase family protein [Bacillus sp. J33]